MSREDKYRAAVQEWQLAYDEAIFPPLSKQERDAIEALNYGLSRASAALGRHMAKCLLQKFDEIDRGNE